MHRRSRFGQIGAVFACALAMATAVIVPGTSAAAAGAMSCGSRTIMASAKGGKAVAVPVSRIRVEGGATCTEAVTVIRGFVEHKVPKGWAVGPGAFKVPHGLHAEIATNGHKKVKFALVGES